ncbi:MAG: hypothetical protein HY897_24825 [Deltaproteobacteria bacterium]|nr:hypothetical protein [Deltaproteobacteria bacterium]
MFPRIIQTAIVGLVLSLLGCSESRTMQSNPLEGIDAGVADTGIGTRMPKCLMEDPRHGHAACSPGDQWACDPFKYNAFAKLPELWWYGKARIRDLWCEMRTDQYVILADEDGKQYPLPFTVFEFDGAIKIGGRNDLPTTLVVRGGYRGVRGDGVEAWDIYWDSYVYDLEPGQDGYLFADSNANMPYMWFFAPIINGKVKVYSQWYTVADFEAAVFK